MTAQLYGIARAAAAAAAYHEALVNTAASDLAQCYKTYRAAMAARNASGYRASRRAYRQACRRVRMTTAMAERAAAAATEACYRYQVAVAHALPR